MSGVRHLPLGGLPVDPAPAAPAKSSGIGCGEGSGPAPEPPPEPPPGPAVASGPGHSFPHAAHARLLVRALDPWREAREFPARWRDYCVTYFRTDIECAAAFGVCERTARKWRQGLGGCNGDKVSMAVQMHPEIVPVLFAAE